MPRGLKIRYYTGFGGHMHKHKVTAKQNNSRMCLVCGLENKLGLLSRFYETENKEVVGIVTGREEHQGYPGRMHGGIVSAILDETIGRAVTIEDPDAWGVTAELSVRFRKPVPLDEELRVVGRIKKSGGKIFSGTGELILKDGTVAATAEGKYVRLKIDSIVEDKDEFHKEWFLFPENDDPERI